jgi:alcohol dehydrogenase class IV
MAYNYNFSLPTTIIMGIDSLNKLPEVCIPYGKRILLVTGRSAMKSTGLSKRVAASLENKGFRTTIFDKVPSEPNLDIVDIGVRCALENDSEIVVGLGGGSALDVAKALAGIANKNTSIKRYMAGRKVEFRGIPFIAIPTTAGTGAEVTPNAVLLDENKKIKKSVRSPYLFAQTAIVDPKLTLSLPPNYTAYSGADALSHAIEAYTSLNSNFLTDALCIEAIRLIGKSLVKVYKEGLRLDLRENMLYGSLLAGIALFNARAGATHGIAHPLGAIYGIHHGLVCGCLLPYVMEFNLSVAEVQKKYSKIAVALGKDVGNLNFLEGAKIAIAKIRQILSELDFPKNLSELGVRRDDFSKIIEDSMPSGSLKANPKKVNRDDARTILERSL